MQKRMLDAVGKSLRAACIMVLGLGGMSALSGCLVAGYSSSGGGFIWPGGFGLVFLLLILFFILRRR
jgi:TRAP-type C4-dicarboxylate transport system permease small subunit